MEKQKFTNISTGIGEQFYNILKIFLNTRIIFQITILS